MITAHDRGTAAVTTNHVAAHADMSPGNLYYRFSDKDEIIRKLDVASPERTRRCRAATRPTSRT